MKNIKHSNYRKIFPEKTLINEPITGNAVKFIQKYFFKTELSRRLEVTIEWQFQIDHL
jgi:hypothetical protein